MTNKLALSICIIVHFCCSEKKVHPQNKNILGNNKTAVESQMQRIDSSAEGHEVYPEHWVWENEISLFELDLVRQGDSIRGTYCAVAYNGERIDCSNDTLSNYLTGVKIGETFFVTFTSSFDESGRDTATIKYDKKRKRLHWFRKTSNLVAYVPDQAILQ